MRNSMLERRTRWRRGHLRRANPGGQTPEMDLRNGFCRRIAGFEGIGHSLDEGGGTWRCCRAGEST